MLVEVVRQREPDRRHRILVVIDNRVATAHPTLMAEIDAYCSTFAPSLQLAAPPLVVPGGEAVKNDLTHPLFVLKHLNEVGVTRG